MISPGAGGDDPRRRVLNDVGSDSGFLAFADISNADLLFMAPALVLAMLALEIVVIATSQFFVGLGIALLIIACAGSYVSICPSHRTPLGLIRSFLTHYHHESTMTFTATDEGTDTPPDVRELSNVRAVEPEADAIRRPDETLVGAVQIEPANLALADAAAWERAATGFGDVLNTLDFPVQIHSSARRVDPERLTGAYESRRTDPDVQSTPALQRIVEVYRERRPKMFRKRGTSLRQYHIVVPVPIQAVSLDDHPWVRRLKRAPVVGDRLAAPLADGLLFDDRRERIETRQREILERRRDHLVDQVTSLEGVSVSHVMAGDLVRIIEEFWSGQRAEYPADGPYQRTTPVVMADQEGESHCSPTHSDPTDIPQ